MTERPGDFLDSIQVASPCRQAWEDMAGDDRVRFCRSCHLRVYHLSGMSRAEAEALVREREGRLCVRFFRRQDGTILTRDCPAAFRRALRWTAGVAAGIVGLCGAIASGGPDRSRWRALFDALGGIGIGPTSEPPLMGLVVLPRPASTARVSGTVRDGTGPIAGVLVSLESRAEECGPVQGTEFRDGRFEPPIVALGPDQRVRIVNRDLEFLTIRFPRAAGRSDTRRIVPGGSTELSFGHPGATLRVEVVGREAEPLAVRGLLGPHFAWSRSDGSFELPLAPPGSYELAVWRPGSNPVRRHVVLADGATLVLDLEGPR